MKLKIKILNKNQTVYVFDFDKSFIVGKLTTENMLAIVFPSVYGKMFGWQNFIITENLMGWIDKSKVKDKKTWI